MADGQTTPPENASGCMECHEGIEPIGQADSEMMEEILAASKASGPGAVLASQKAPKHGRRPASR